jgi:hypothetical protein
MAETEPPGVYVEAAGLPGPIEGVPTDALTWSDRAIWRLATIGGLVLAGLGIGLSLTRGNELAELIAMPGGAEGMLAILGAALLFGTVRGLVEWRRRSKGRPLLRYGKLAFGVLFFQLATLVAVGICLPVWLASFLVAPAYSWHLGMTFMNLLIGCVFIKFAGGAVRDLMLLVQAVRSPR